MRRNALSQVAGWGDGTRVVDASRLVVLGDLVPSCLLDTLLQASAAGGACRAVLNHLVDGTGRAGGLDIAVIARALAIVALHETRIDHAVVARRGSHAAIALLHDDRKDEPGINPCRSGNGLDAVGDVVDFVVGVVGHIPLFAGALHDGLVVLEPAQEPSALRFPYQV